MGEKEQLKMELNQVIYRHNMLGVMEVKLLQMREIAKRANEDNLSEAEIQVLNAKLNNLEAQVNTIDKISRINLT